MCLVLCLAAALRAHRAQASGVAVLALAVFLLLALVWILLDWENPLKWMEALNKQIRHEHMRQYREE
jgi:hypothetical protein